MNREDCGGDCGNCQRCRAYAEEMERLDYERQREHENREEDERT